MTQKEKELVLKDLCARLPYGITICRITDNSIHRIQYSDITENIDQFSHFLEYSGIDNIKPYLRPMSSMTEKERDEIAFIRDRDFQSVRKWVHDESIKETGNICPVTWGEIDFCNKKHLDYRGLISMGLTLEAPKDMYNTSKSITLENIKYGTDKIVKDAKRVVMSPEEMKEMEDVMYNEHGWKNIGNGLKMDRHGNIAGGLKIQ